LKKAQRSFVVEYKSGRRKPNATSNSIWGNMDLKSVALHFEDGAMQLVPDGRLLSKFTGEVSPSKAQPVALMLTQSIGQHTTAAGIEETMMADEIDTIDKTDAPAVVETPIAPKKQRKPRATKGAPEAVSVDAAAEPAIASGKQKRGRKVKSVENVGAAKRAPVKRASKAVQAAPVVPASPSDEMTELLQLEEENPRLRKLLAEKLQAENADLRKRLKLD
jgi:hypothetical protein